jgi:hypothetical protein
MRLLTEEDIIARFGTPGETAIPSPPTRRVGDVRKLFQPRELRRARCTCGKNITICFTPLPGVPILCRRCIRDRKRRKQSFATAFGMGG